MNVTEARALRARLQEAKRMLDGEFAKTDEELSTAIRPHAMSETNTVVFRPGETPGYSVAELSLIRVMNAVNVLNRALEVTKTEVVRASMETPGKAANS